MFQILTFEIEPHPNQKLSQMYKPESEPKRISYNLIQNGEIKSPLHS